MKKLFAVTAVRSSAPQHYDTMALVGLCRSDTKKCCYCNEPIQKKEAILRFGKKGKRQCHYCCSLDYSGVGEVLNQRDLKEIFMDFYNFHKSRILKNAG